MKENNKIIINCTTEDKMKIQKQADKVGLTLKEYSLKVLLNTEVQIKLVSR